MTKMRVSAPKQEPRARRGGARASASVQPSSLQSVALQPARVTLSRAEAVPARPSSLEMPSLDRLDIRQSASSLPVLQRQPQVMPAIREVQQTAESVVPQDWATEDLKRRFAATVLAESYDGQEQDILWIYFNDLNAKKGEAGLSRSAAFSGKSDWYKIWLYLLGDTQYGSEALPQTKKNGKPSDFHGFPSIEEFCQKNGYMQSVASKRATKVAALIAQAFAEPSRNPYEGWSGQGNLNDFNNVSNKDKYWTRARYYYWLQQEKKVTEIYVKVLPAGPNTQFLFHADKILKYFTDNKIQLPAEVKKYEP